MPNLLTYFRPRRRLPQDTTSIPPTAPGAALAVRSRVSGEPPLAILVQRRRSLPTLPREPSVGIAPTYRPVAKRRIDPAWLAVVCPRKSRNVRRAIPDTSRFVLPLRLPRKRRVPPDWERPIPRPSAWSRGLIIHIGDLEADLSTSIGSGAPFLGGFRVTDLYWLSASAIGLTFTTTYGTDYQYQLYAGRQLIGKTLSTSTREIVGQLQPSEYPQFLTVLAVDPSEVNTDYGDLLPIRPYNRVKLRWATVGMPDDAKWIEITSGTVAGGAVSLSNVLALVPFDIDRFYEYLTDPLAGTGTWNFEIAHRDLRPPDGNRGTAATASTAVVAIPPDVAPQSDGSRFTIAVASQTATVSFSFP